MYTKLASKPKSGGLRWPSHRCLLPTVNFDSQICTSGIRNSIFRLSGPCHALISQRNNQEQIMYCNYSHICAIFCAQNLPGLSSDPNRKSSRKAEAGCTERSDWPTQTYQPMRSSLTSVFGYRTAKWRRQPGKKTAKRVNIEIFLSLPPTGGIKII